MSARVYVVGTDTNAGKTTVTCALLHAARRRGIRAVPFKPSLTGPSGPQSDPARLLRAAGMSEDEYGAAAPLRFEEPLAPGIAEDPARFLPGDERPPDDAKLASIQWSLATFEERHEADLVLIEAAGGLHVPMPGGRWQDHWIETLAYNTLVVARAGIGTINHTLLTIDALRERGCAPLGFLTSQGRPRKDPSRADNAAVIQERAELRCLGELPYLGTPPKLPEDDGWLDEEIWTLLLRAR